MSSSLLVGNKLLHGAAFNGRKERGLAQVAGTLGRLLGKYVALKGLGALYSSAFGDAETLRGAGMGLLFGHGVFLLLCECLLGVLGGQEHGHAAALQSRFLFHGAVILDDDLHGVPQVFVEGDLLAAFAGERLLWRLPRLDLPADELPVSAE